MATREVSTVSTAWPVFSVVDAIPLAVISKTEELRAIIGPKKYEALVMEAIQNVGCTSLPKMRQNFLRR
ncbi:MAG: hypothetical protein ACRC9K_24135 [Afipia sp.]